MGGSYSDFERLEIARQEYEEYTVGAQVRIKNINGEKINIGTVKEVFSDNTGLDGYVIENPKTKEITILFQGSKGPSLEKKSLYDWKYNNLPMVGKIFTGAQKVTPQLQAAADKLNQVLREFPDSKINIYAHSLGIMDAQYALANVDDITRIKEAHLYQGPNIYPNLTKEQREKVDAMKYRIHNYEDTRDIVALNYHRKDSKDSEMAVGIVHYVDSKRRLNPVDQHMWGGYVFDEKGSLRTKNSSADYETKFAFAYDIVKSGLYLNSIVKKQVSTDGISSGEEIFLDSNQAQVVASGIHQTARIGYEEIKKIQLMAHDEAERILLSTHDVPFGFISSPYEVEEAYCKGGAHRGNIVDSVDLVFNPKVEKAKKLLEDLEKLESSLKKSIEEMVEQDKQLSEEFYKWNNSK